MSPSSFHGHHKNRLSDGASGRLQVSQLSLKIGIGRVGEHDNGCRHTRPPPSPASGSTSTWKATGETVFRHACKRGLEGIVSKRQGLALPLRALARLAQDEEPGVRGGEAGG